MSDTSDTSAIDEKRNETSGPQSTDYLIDIKNFIVSVIATLIVIILYFSLGGLIIFSCKLAQSNILPTDSRCYPYTDSKPDIKPIQTNIFTTFQEPQVSMKMSFPYNDYNASNSVLDMFREYKGVGNSNFLANYIIEIMESLFSFSYGSINKILNMINGLPEIILVLFGPFIIGFLSLFVLIAQNIYAIYLWFASMRWFFKTNTNESASGLPKWTNVTVTDPVNYGISIALVIGFIILFFFTMPVIFFISFLTFIFCAFTCISYKAEMNGKSAYASTVVQDIFKYYKLPIMIIFSLFVVSSAFSKLGTAPGIFSIITLFAIYFGLISIDTFKTIEIENMTPVVSFEQARKKCAGVEPVKSAVSFLGSLFGQKGGAISREIKNASKILSKK
jgi:hypothetical protein